MTQAHYSLQFDSNRLGALSENCRNWLKGQTLSLNTHQGEAYHLTLHQAPELLTQLPDTLLEQLIWAALAHTHFAVMVWPLHLGLHTGKVMTFESCNQQQLKEIGDSGFIAISKQPLPTNDLAKVNIGLMGVAARPLLTQQQTNGHTLLAVKSHYQQLLRALKNALPLKHKVWLKRHLMNILHFKNAYTQTNRPDLVPWARSKSWNAAIHQPCLSIQNNRANQRTPILFALHWLELGGAEKFAVDLIKSLPKDQYAVYVTTDVASSNSWTAEIAGIAEEILHLPDFLSPHYFSIFYEYYIRSRGIKLMHLHHAARAYESLFHIRRFHPTLKILDSLHIIELPPHEGGYVEFSAANHEVFIDHHHVISQQLQKFLEQRWQIPAEKISCIYLNVDTDYFDPAIIDAGQFRQKLGIAEDACLVGFVGRLNPQKRPLEFIRMAQRLQQRWIKSQQPRALHFVMVGGGILEKAVQKAIANSGLSNIILYGEVGDPRCIYRDCDLLLMPSVNEGLALVSYESMAMETPIFFTDVGAQSELMPTALIIPETPFLAEHMADAAWPLLINPEACAALGKQLRQHVLTHHRQHQTLDDIGELYEALLEQ